MLEAEGGTWDLCYESKTDAADIVTNSANLEHQRGHRNNRGGWGGAGLQKTEGIGEGFSSGWTCAGVYSCQDDRDGFTRKAEGGVGDQAIQPKKKC